MKNKNETRESTSLKPNNNIENALVDLQTSIDEIMENNTVTSEVQYKTFYERTKNFLKNYDEVNKSKDFTNKKKILSYQQQFVDKLKYLNDALVVLPEEDLGKFDKKCIRRASALIDLLDNEKTSLSLKNKWENFKVTRKNKKAKKEAEDNKRSASIDLETTVELSDNSKEIEKEMEEVLKQDQKIKEYVRNKALKNLLKKFLPTDEYFNKVEANKKYNNQLAYELLTPYFHKKFIAEKKTYKDPYGRIDPETKQVKQVEYKYFAKSTEIKSGKQSKSQNKKCVAAINDEIQKQLDNTVEDYVEKNIKMADIIKWEKNKLEKNNGATASFIQNAHKEFGLA